jgi:exodeoxyribonuclease-3
VPEPTYKIWVGENPAKGIGIFSYSDLEVTLHELYDPTLRYVVPIKVSGSKCFNLLAIWAMGSENERGRHLQLESGPANAAWSGVGASYDDVPF